MLVEKYALKTVPLSYKVNYLKIPVNNIPITQDGAKKFNEFYLYFLNKKYRQIVRTHSGGISVEKHNFRPPMWDIIVESSYLEITVVDEKCYRIQFSNFAQQKDNVSGRQSFLTFRSVCKKYGVEIEKLGIDNGEEVKKTIERAKIELFAEPKEVVNNCHHLDLNSSHISGMAKYHPELAGPLTEIYNKRKENQTYKHILTHCWGYLQSKYVGYKYAHISRDGIKYTNDRIKELTERLEMSGRRIIAWNTDGIWYQGEVYHSADEGTELGQWKNDHINCVFRAKSKGAYEFIENGKYEAVVRGRTNYDKVKPREEWQWGDIFRKDAEVVLFMFDYELGVIIEEG